MSFTEWHANFFQFIYLGAPNTRLCQCNSKHQRALWLFPFWTRSNFSFLPPPPIYDDSCSLWLLLRLPVSWKLLTDSKGMINPRNLEGTVPLPLSDLGRLHLERSFSNGGWYGIEEGPRAKEGGTGSSGLSPYARAKGEVLAVSTPDCQDSRADRNREEFKHRKENAFLWSNSNTDAGMVMGARKIVIAYNTRKTWV